MTQHGQDRTSMGGAATSPGGSPAVAEARGAGEELKGAAQDVAAEVRAAGSAVREEVGGLGGTIKQGLTAQAEQRKNAIADRLGAVADRAQRTADDLRDSEAWLGDLVARGARELNSVADEIRGQDVQGLVSSVEVFARRQPALFMGATVALGFAMTRIVTGGGSSPDPTDRRQGFAPGAGEPGGAAFDFVRNDDYPRPTTSRPGAAPVVGGSNI